MNAAFEVHREGVAVLEHNVAKALTVASCTGIVSRVGRRPSHPWQHHVRSAYLGERRL